MSNVSIRNARKVYARTEVIHGVDLEISQGEFVVILGPSGCGKSTLLRMVAGLEAITSGEVAIGGRVVNLLEPRERGCAMVFQNYALYPHMSVAENIGYSLKINGVPKSDRLKRVQAIAHSLGLAEFLERKPGQLSGGQRQRVAMGRAMIREPKVFLYDEPLSNLDAKLRVAMRIEIKRLQRQLGTTTLFVTHDQVEAMTLADKIVVMNKGTIEQVGSPRQIYDSPASTYVAGFIGMPGMNLLKVNVDPQRSILILSDGQAIGYDSGLCPGLAEGEVVLGFRAEDVTISNASRDLRAEVSFVEELGASHLMHCQLAGSTVVCVTHSRASLSPGELTGLVLDAQKFHFFDISTGRRLEPERKISEVDKVAA